MTAEEDLTQLSLKYTSVGCVSESLHIVKKKKKRAAN